MSYRAHPVILSDLFLKFVAEFMKQCTQAGLESGRSLARCEPRAGYFQ